MRSQSVVTSEPFRPDRPGDLPEDERAVASALAHAAAGYPVVPLRAHDKRPVSKGLRYGIRDQGEIWSAWQRWPGSDVGLVLDETCLVVPDIDGPDGWGSLQQMGERAGLELPATYEVATGRGKHLYFRVPDEAPGPLTCQYGHQHGRPGLDVKTKWLLVAPGSRHRFGRLYVANWDHVPTVAELPVLPPSWWAQIEERQKRTFKRAASRGPAGRSASDPEDFRVGTPVVLDGGMGRRLASLLDDTSDGRDGRVYAAVLTMRRAGCSHADIRATVLSSPLGQKAWQESPQPLVWLESKIKAADRAIEEVVAGCDPAAWWQAVLTGGLKEPHVRVAAHLLGQGIYWGTVTRSKGRIALGSAMSEASASRAVDEIVKAGWLEVVRPRDPKTMTPARYALLVPTENEQMWGGEAQDSQVPPAPPSLINSPSKMIAYADHDAFRPGPGDGGAPTLHGGFRVLCLLEYEGPMNTADLADRLDRDATSTRRLLRPLRKAGLVKSDRRVHRLVPQPLGPLLDEAARASRTLGMKAVAEKEYVRDAEEYRRRRHEMGTVGTPEWRRLMFRDFREANDHPSRQALRNAWLSEGYTLDDLALHMVDAYETRLLRRGKPSLWQAS